MISNIMKEKIAIIGVGSAGIQSICQMLVWTDESYEITSIYNPDIPIIGIGESTNPSFVEALELGLDFNLYDDIKKINGTLKLGSRYKKWRQNDFMSPLLMGTVAIHFNTHKLVEFSLPRLRQRWAGKFNEVLGTVTALQNLKDRVDVTVNGKVSSYDYVIDCTGFPTDFLDCEMPEMPVNHCLVHNMPQNDNEWLYTGHVATPDGWMFEVPLTNRVSYGYLFNDTITNEATAKENFSKEIGVPVEALENKEYKFKSYYSKKILDGRICKNGNRAIFFEPLFANSLWFYNQISMLFNEHIKGQATEQEVNDRFSVFANQVREMIWFKYHGGSIHNTPFWQHVQTQGKQEVKNSVNLARVQEGLKEMNTTRDWGTVHRDLKWIYNALNLTIVDKRFEYNYFQP
jgi:hypothetical protein